MWSKYTGTQYFAAYSERKISFRKNSCISAKTSRSFTFRKINLFFCKTILKWKAAVLTEHFSAQKPGIAILRWVMALCLFPSVHSTSLSPPVSLPSVSHLPLASLPQSLPSLSSLCLPPCLIWLPIIAGTWIDAIIACSKYCIGPVNHVIAIIISRNSITRNVFKFHV